MNNAPHDFDSEAYGTTAAMRYNIFESRPSGFARRLAPRIWRFYQNMCIGQDNNCLLDGGCGTGQLAGHFLAKGAQVVGLDRSPHMLKYARQNNTSYVVTGQARFVEGDASDFQFDQQFGLVVCTFNTLNHLDSFRGLERCLACVHRALAPGGYFLFDINTRRGLKKTVESNELLDTDEEIIVRKRFCDGDRVVLYASGCFYHEDRWHRYRETIFKIKICTEWLRQCLLDVGWTSCQFTQDDFLNPIEKPEAESVAYGVARKSA